MTTKKALARLLHFFVSHHYEESKNPYFYKEVKDAYAALKIGRFDDGSGDALADMAKGRRSRIRRK